MPNILGGIRGVVLPALVCLAVLNSGGCVGTRMTQVRGIEQGADFNGTFVSNALPAVAVVPAPGFTLVTGGRTGANVSVGGSLMGGAGADVWYALYVGPNSGSANISVDGLAQLAVSLADISDNMTWSLNPGFTERRGLPMLHENNVTLAGHNFVALTYVRPVRSDPWMPAFIQAGQGWEGDILLCQYTWWTQANRTKLVVEYREAAPTQGLRPPPLGDTEFLAAFEQRADAAFSVLRARAGDTLPAQVAALHDNPARISPRLLSAVLGEVMPDLRLRLRD